MASHEDDSTLGSDVASAGKGVYLTFLLFILAIFAFATANMTQVSKDLAYFYLTFSLVPLLAIVIDMVFRKIENKLDLPDTVTIEDRSPVFGHHGKRLKILIVAGSLFMAGFWFLALSDQSTVALIDSPAFSLIEPGVVGSAGLSAIAGAIEDAFFQAFILATSYVLIRRLLGSLSGAKWVALVLAILVASAMFTLYHVAVYGNDAAKMDQVFYFGLLCSGSTAVTGMIVTCTSLHMANNLGVTLFRAISTDVFLYVLLYWLVIAALTYGAWRRT